MNDLFKTEFFILMNNNFSKITNEQMQIAYEYFIKKIIKYPVNEDYEQSFRKLNLTRIEFSSLQMLYQFEQGKKMR